MGAYSELDIERNGSDDRDSTQTGLSFVDAPDDENPFTQDNTPEEKPLTAEEPAADAGTAVTPDSEKAAPEMPGAADSKPEATETENAKRKAHEEAEAKRKAEFDAKQAAKKAAKQEKLAQVAAMSDDEVMMASMKLVSEATERLTRRNMKECVSEYVQTKCIEDPSFARLTLHPRKSMVHCFWYINRKAREFVEQEMKDNDIKPEHVNGVYGSDVPDELCYQWAEEYFRDPNAQEDHKDDEKFTPKPYYYGGRASTSKKSAEKDKKKVEKKPAEKPTPKPAPKDDGGQISMLGVA